MEIFWATFECTIHKNIIHITQTFQIDITRENNNTIIYVIQLQELLWLTGFNRHTYLIKLDAHHFSILVGLDVFFCVHDKLISSWCKLVSDMVCNCFLIILDGLAVASSEAFLLALHLNCWRSAFLSSGSWLCSFFYIYDTWVFHISCQSYSTLFVTTMLWIFTMFKSWQKYIKISFTYNTFISSICS